MCVDVYTKAWIFMSNELDKIETCQLLLSFIIYVDLHRLYQLNYLVLQILSVQLTNGFEVLQRYFFGM